MPGEGVSRFCGHVKNPKRTRLARTAAGDHEFAPWYQLLFGG